MRYDDADTNQYRELADEAIKVMNESTSGFSTRIADEATYRLQKEEAIFATGKNTANTAQSVKELDKRLTAESSERKASDAANMKYTRRMDRISLGIAISGVLLAIAALVVSIIK